LEERSARTEDYLELIDELIQEKGYARGVEIADRLHVKQPTVTLMLQRLAGKGLVVYQKNRGVNLTSKGRKLARAMRQTHAIIAEFLHLIGIDLKLANKVAEDVEHCLPSEVIDKLESLAVRLKEDRSLTEPLKSGIEAASPV
jgi:Mn-dependent DtxR family transcriptional regulator